LTDRSYAGLPRLLALYRQWMDYSRRRVFSGGCFFAAVTAEFDARDGEMRDVLRERRTNWLGLQQQLIAEAQQSGSARCRCRRVPVGVRVGRLRDFPHLQPASPLPAVRANTLVPIHFGVDEPPYYAEEPDVLGRAEAAAARLALILSVLQAGESLDIGKRRAA
jgi:hypothetical protein